MYTLAVHGSHLMQFARAIGDVTGEYDEVDRLTATGDDALVAPPTFLMAADHFDPDYRRRPRPGVPWVGSEDARPDQPVGFHLEQHFTFHRPVRAGQVLTAESRPGETWQRTGRRAGTMTFSETLTDYRDPAGAPVASARWVQASVERRPPTVDCDPAAAAPPSLPTSPPPSETTNAPAPGSGAGRTWTTVLTEELTRAQLVMYAGASGDFHPLHTDDVYARRRGYPGVFAHGMLTMGMSGRAVTDRYGHAAVLRFGGRITGQAWPGDALVATTEIAEVRDDPRGTVADLTVTTRNQHGAPLFVGGATVRATGLAVGIRGEH